MTHKNFVALFSSLLLLALASATAGANDAFISTAKVLPQNNAIAIQDVQIAAVEISLFPQIPSARLTRNLLWKAPEPGRTTPLPANEISTNSAPVRTGVFCDAKERVTTKRPTEKVHTGVFGTPQGLQGNGLGNLLQSGLLAPPDGPGTENGTLDRQSDQGRRPRTGGHSIWSRILRGR